MTNEPNTAPTIQAMVWYKEEDWDSLLELFTDSDLLPASHKDWLIRAEELKKKIEGSGDIVVKVFIDPQTFPAWCKEKGTPMDASARTELAIEVTTRQNLSI